MDYSKLVIKKTDIITAVIEKLQSIDKHNVVLVIEEGSDILSSDVTLLLIKELINELKKDIVIVTRDKIGFETAKRVGFTVVQSEREVVSTIWGRKRNMQKQPSVNMPVNNSAKQGNIVPTSSGLEVAIGSDISQSQKFVGRDWSHPPITPDGPKQGVATVKRISFISKLPKIKIGSVFKNKMLLLIIFFSVLGGGLWFFYYYTLVPKTKITLYPKNIEVSIEETITAQEDAIGMDIEKRVISLKMEEEELSRSDYADATGTDYEGTKATGEVTIYNSTDEEVMFEAGTAISNGTLEFTMDSSVTVPSRVNELEEGTATVGVTAVGVGEEYNLSAGTVFSINGSNLSAINPVAFSGGSKTEYTYVSKKDIDDLVKKVTKDLEEELKQRMHELHPNDDWVLIESSIKIEPVNKDEPYKSDVPEGAKTDVVNVTVNLKATAAYYNSSEINAIVKELLIESYKKEENTNMVNLELSENIETDIKQIEKQNDKAFRINLDAKGIMLTKLDTDQIVFDLKGRKWDDGLDYLKGLPYMEKEATVEYFPSNYLEWIKHFPFYDSKISIQVDTEN